MQKRDFLSLLKEDLAGLVLAVLIGLMGYGAKLIMQSPIADPLLVAMVMGIVVRTATGGSTRLRPGFTVAPMIFIPLGIGFYAANNLNFVKFAKVQTSIISILIVVIFVYFAVILLLGKLLGQKKQITYLTATGSAICGASAIAITSPAVEAEPDDISISLLSVALAALVGLFIILPFCATLLGITDRNYSLLSASVLQFTGFVKAAVGSAAFLSTDTPVRDLMSLALSVKAVRYLGLLIAIPLFASLVRKKLYIPWILWFFLGCGLLGTWVYSSNETFYTETLTPLIRPIYDVSWSIAMAAIGLNVDARELLSNNGTKALIMAFTGFFAATATFFIGLYIFVIR